MFARGNDSRSEPYRDRLQLRHPMQRAIIVQVASCGAVDEARTRPQPQFNFAVAGCPVVAECPTPKTDP